MHNNLKVNKTGLFIKIFFTTGAIFWLSLSVDWALLLNKISGMNWLILFFSLTLYSLWIVPCSMRWRHIAASCGYFFSLKESTHGYLIGAFFSSFLPTAKGGDLVRGIFIARDHGFSSGGLLATIFVERFIGLMMAIMLVLFASLISASRYAVLEHLVISAATLALFLIVVVLIFFNRHFRKMLSLFIEMLPFTRVKNVSYEIFKVLDTCSEKPNLILLTMFFSLLNQMVLIGSGFIMALAIPGFNAPWIAFGLVIPLSFITVLLPSIGGYGIREAGFIIFFGWFGVSGEAAGLFSLLQLLFLWLFSFAGGICFIRRKVPKLIP